MLGLGRGGRDQNWLQRILKWPVEFQISYELSFLSGHIPGVGLGMLDSCCCGFASTCSLMYAGRALCFCFCTRVHGESKFQSLIFLPQCELVYLPFGYKSFYLQSSSREAAGLGLLGWRWQ